MLPRWHILFGAIFTLLIWYFAPGLNWIYLALVFLSSVLIDLDHYISAAIKTKKWDLESALIYHKNLGIKEEKERARGIRKKADFHLFHTIEFHILIALIGIFWAPFFYIFIGLAYHSLLDLFYLIGKDYLYRREYFFFNWLGKKIV